MAAPEGWAPLVAELTPHVSPEWRRHAEEHGDQAWVRLILLVDAHFLLSQPRVAEKVAMTMADLAREGSPEQEGWNAIQQSASDARVELAQRLVDAADVLLSDELKPLFVRSIEPTIMR
ncbi:MAG: hypothetical protein QOD86_1939 [Miltoncostaeaceae bacterium]|jgi:hypothetical protein|nr:hypothetical protein [Miltoncostaeaceae bacterium]